MPSDNNLRRCFTVLFADVSSVGSQVASHASGDQDVTAIPFSSQNARSGSCVRYGWSSTGSPLAQHLLLQGFQDDGHDDWRHLCTDQFFVIQPFNRFMLTYFSTQANVSNIDPNNLSLVSSMKSRRARSVPVIAPTVFHTSM